VTNDLLLLQFVSKIDQNNPENQRILISARGLIIAKAEMIRQRCCNALRRSFALHIPSPSSTSYFLPAMRAL
jgi:hypothetical protein